MTRGVAIAEDSIQPFADVQIIKTRERLRDRHLQGPSAEYVFLQRLDDWYVPRRNWLAPEQPRLAGPWKSIVAIGVRFRKLRITIGRDDERIAREQERITLPGIEMAPIGPCNDETAFFAAAERLWYLLRVLLVFRFRQPVYTLVETKVGTGERDTIWHSVRLEPRERSIDQTDPPFRAPLETYLANGAAALLTMENNRELLHAAAYGYASSYKARVIETRLTSCIEGMECLVEAFEQARGLTREAIERKRWKKLGQAVRRVATPVGETPEERDAIVRALSGVPTLRLLERITRMVKEQRPEWRKLPEELLEGAEGMIKARNDIVHGRIVDDPTALRIEVLRAQSLFERLWLGLLSCGNLPTDGWVDYQIRAYTMGKAKISDL